jgi:hypothetical protein
MMLCPLVACVWMMNDSLLGVCKKYAVGEHAYVKIHGNP